MVTDAEKRSIAKIVDAYESGLSRIWSTFFGSKFPDSDAGQRVSKALVGIIPVSQYIAESKDVLEVKAKLSDYLGYMDDHGLVDRVIQGEIGALLAGEDSESFMEDEDYIESADNATALADDARAALA